MTIRAWRITKARHAAGASSGNGARTFGGRWNSPGTPMFYTAGSTSLAILEMLVHLQAAELIRRYVLFEISFDDSLVIEIAPVRLPKGWRKSPPPRTTQFVGDRWILARDTAILKTPSAIVPSEWNYLLNPAHPDLKRIKIGPKQPIQFDPRLVKIP
jgi:RES domain-containing protein